jgi:uncharacterized protein
MSRDYPDWINTEKAAQAKRVYRGSVEVEELPRLDGMIVKGQDSEIDFEVAFGLDGQGQIVADLAVRGDVTLQCQRTLTTFRQAIASRSKVGIVADERQEAELPEDYEARLCPDHRLELLDLVGEEVLLALPLVPVDPASEPLPDLEGSGDTHRPFAALDKLSKNSK